MFKEMSYVYAVYQEKSFTKAAQKLYLSQPALSAMVKKAEQKIGTPIFDRSTSPITLTAAGKYYIEQAGKIMQIQRDAESYFHLLSINSDNCLRLGGSFFFLSYIFPPAAKQFQEQFGEVNVSFVESRNNELVSKLLNNEIDFFLEVDDLQSDRIDRFVWGKEQLILAVPACWPINGRLMDYQLTAEDIHDRKHLTDSVPAVDPAVFANEPFILLRKGNDSYCRAIDICKNAGFVPKDIYMTADQMLTSYYLAAEGHGVAFIRDSILFHADLTENLLFYKLDDPLTARSIYLYYRRGGALSSVAQAFLHFIQTSSPQ